MPIALPVLQPPRPPTSAQPRLLSSWLLSALALLAPSGLGADDWPGWLGPRRDGVWREKGILKTFPADGLRTVWRQSIGGGYGGPAVVGQRVLVMDRIPKPPNPETLAALARDFGEAPNHHYERGISLSTERVLCLDDSDGRILWTHEYDCPYTTAVEYANGPRVTPLVDGDRVYTLGAEGNFFCLRLDTGKVIWSRDWTKDYAVEVPIWGFAAHPLIEGNKLFCVVGGDGTAVIAYDKESGKELWRALSCERPGYSAPVIVRVEGRRVLLIWHGESINGLNPDNGDVLWSVPVETHVGMAIGTPRVLGDALFVSGFRYGSTCVTLGSAPELRWRGAAKSGVSSTLATPLLMDGHIYSCDGDGGYVCVDLSNGERLWKDYGPTAGGQRARWGNVFTVRHANRLFLLNDDGELIIAQVSPAGYRERSRTRLIEPTTILGSRTVVWSHPAFAHRRVYARNDREIICVSLADESSGAKNAAE